MDGREGMALQGSTPYYLHRIPGAAQSGQLGSTPLPPGFRASSNPNNDTMSVAQPAVVRAPSISVGSTVAFNVEGGCGVGGGRSQHQQTQHGGHPQGFTITVASTGGTLSEPTKKKRGRPRKYRPDGPRPGAASGSSVVALGLSPSTPNSGSLGDRKKRGRPPGSGRKQRLSSVGEWMSNSAGVAFMPHVIQVAPGEDIAGKILTFAQQRPRALCIMSGSGGVSAVELRQPASTSGNVKFEGRFEILCLSGSFLVAETGGSRNRTGGVNVSLSSPDGHVIGGAVGGRLVASRPVQVVVCSFVYENTKPKDKESDLKEERSSEQPVSDKTSMQIIGSPSQNVAGSWPGSKAVDSKNLNTDIDLASG